MPSCPAPLQVLRDKATNIGRASSQVSSALVFASICE